MHSRFTVKIIHISDKFPIHISTLLIYLIFHINDLSMMYYYVMQFQLFMILVENVLSSSQIWKRKIRYFNNEWIKLASGCH